MEIFLQIVIQTTAMESNILSRDSLIRIITIKFKKEVVQPLQGIRICNKLSGDLEKI